MPEPVNPPLPAFDELVDAIASGQPFWGAWALPDALYGIAGRRRAGELRELLAAAAPRTPWYDAALAVIASDFAAAGDVVVARRQLGAAVAFFRRVGARAHLRDAAALANALPATPAAAPSRRSAR